MIKPRPHFEGLNATINTTEDCNLRCKYCYEINKRPRSIDIDKCYKFIDILFDPDQVVPTEHEWLTNGLIIDFIGGDSLVDPNLLDKILTYLNYKYTIGNKYKEKGWRCSISTNGTLFSNPDVKAFCEKWREHLSIGVSIDGCPEIHDMNRVYPDGTGTMKDIIKNWSWYRELFPETSRGTKATCARNTIPYLYKSLKFMHEELGLDNISQNFIMEDTGCTQEDYDLLDEQLRKCADYVLEHCDDLYWSMLDEHQFYPEANESGINDPDFFTKGRCGSGCMPCLSIDGKIYPCFRWLPHTQVTTQGAMCVGNVEEGFSHAENFIRVQQGSIRANCTKEEKCRTCEYEKACSYCIGGCYAEHGDFVRTTHICEITKLQCKWTKYYWDEYYKTHEREGRI